MKRTVLIKNFPCKTYEKLVLIKARENRDYAPIIADAIDLYTAQKKKKQ